MKVGFSSGLSVNYSPNADGKRVLLPFDDTATQRPGFNVRVVLNFFDELRRRVQ
jgi:hypothetical protein